MARGARASGAMRRAAVLAVGLAAAAAIALALRHPAPPSAPAGGYAGSAACVACHAEEVRAWRDSAHHWAMLRATPDAPLRAPRGGPLAEDAGGLVLAGDRVGHAGDLHLA